MCLDDIIISDSEILKITANISVKLTLILVFLMHETRILKHLQLNWKCSV